MNSYNTICRILGKKTGSKLLGGLASFAGGGAAAYVFNILAAASKIGSTDNVTMTPFGIMDFNYALSIPLAGAAVGAGVLSEVITAASLNLSGVSTKRGYNVVPVFQATTYAFVVAAGMAVNYNYGAKEAEPRSHELAMKILEECEKSERNETVDIKVYNPYFCP